MMIFPSDDVIVSFSGRVLASNERVSSAGRKIFPSAAWRRRFSVTFTRRPQAEATRSF